MIEDRREVSAIRDPDYQNRSFSESDIEKGRHRSFVGGKWEEMGQHQREFLINQGLRPDHKFLDVGCGALRAGGPLAAYLAPGNYYGIDVNHELIDTGYRLELDDATRERLPESNLRATDRFDADFGVQFDMAIAQSVFTHISLNHIRLCLFRLAKVVKPGGKFYATIFSQPKSFPIDGIVERKHHHYQERNIFWYYRSDMMWVAQGMPWQFNWIGDWGHSRGQRMVEYTRLPD